jgi:hypothetical protein
MAAADSRALELGLDVDIDELASDSLQVDAVEVWI